MANKQTRRSVSMNRAKFDKFQEWCKANNKSMSHAVEDAVEMIMNLDAYAKKQQVSETKPPVVMDTRLYGDG